MMSRVASAARHETACPRAATVPVSGASANTAANRVRHDGGPERGVAARDAPSRPSRTLAVVAQWSSPNMKVRPKPVITSSTIREGAVAGADVAQRREAAAHWGTLIACRNARGSRDSPRPPCRAPRAGSRARRRGRTRASIRPRRCRGLYRPGDGGRPVDEPGPGPPPRLARLGDAGRFYRPVRRAVVACRPGR